MAAELDSRGNGSLDQRTITVCSGLDLVNITYNNFVAQDEPSATVSALEWERHVSGLCFRTVTFPQLVFPHNSIQHRVFLHVVFPHQTFFFLSFFLTFFFLLSFLSSFLPTFLLSILSSFLPSFFPFFTSFFLLHLVWKCYMRKSWCGIE